MVRCPQSAATAWTAAHHVDNHRARLEVGRHGTSPNRSIARRRQRRHLLPARWPRAGARSRHPQYNRGREAGRPGACWTRDISSAQSRTCCARVGRYGRRRDVPRDPRHCGDPAYPLGHNQTRKHVSRNSRSTHSTASTSSSRSKTSSTSMFPMKRRSRSARFVT